MPRSLTIDVLKIMAAQLIFWHHLSAYGDLAQWFSEIAPRLHDFLFGYARMAVQVFLVVSGFLLAQHIKLDQRPACLSSVTSRYLRLSPVYWVALLWVSLCVALAKPYLSADWLPDAPTWSQALAHVMLLQNLLDHPSLSTGIWYVAIDLQLYLLLISLAFLTHIFAPQHLREDCFSFLLLGLITLSVLVQLRSGMGQLGDLFFRLLWAGLFGTQRKKHLSPSLVLLASNMDRVTLACHVLALALRLGLWRSSIAMVCA